MEEKEKMAVGLPENAFRELQPGEEYQPIMQPDKTYPEVNGWSVTWGILMAVLFSAAAAYLPIGAYLNGHESHQKSLLR